MATASKRSVVKFPFLYRRLIELSEFSRRIYTKTFLGYGGIASKSELNLLDEVGTDFCGAGCVVYEPPPLLNQGVSFVHHNDAYLIGNPPIGVTSDGTIIQDTIFRTEERTFSAVSSLHLKAQREIVRLKSGKSLKLTTVDRPMCSLLSAWNHFGHFIPEHFLKIYCIQTEYDINDFQYVIESNAAKWKRELLDLAGIKPINIIEWSGQSKRIRNLFVPDYPEISKAGFDWINGLFPPVSGANPTLKLYLSRQKMNTRYIINSVEVEKKLVSHGFQTIVPEEMSLNEQVHLFRSARVLAGPNGSAFTNQIFMPSNSHILEFFGTDRVHYFNRQVAKVKEHMYHSLLDPRPNLVTHNTGVFVDIKQLEITLLQIDSLL